MSDLKQFNIPKLHRRRFLRNLSYAALALPFYRTLLETQVFAAASPVRMLLVYYPDGAIMSDFFPSGGQYPMITKPLETLDKDLNFYSGLDYMTGGSHEGGMAYLWTGGGNQNSIDTYVGAKIGARYPLKVLRLGSLSTFQAGEGASLENGNGTMIEDNPAKAFLNVFGGAASPDASPEEQERIKQQQMRDIQAKKSLLDFQMGEIKSLQKILANDEKQKLEAHLESLRELERRIQTMGAEGSMNGGVGATECFSNLDMRGLSLPVNAKGYPLPHHQNDIYGTVIDIQSDIMLQALACGKTMTGTLSFSHKVSNLDLNFLGAPPGGSGELHSASHYGSRDSDAARKYNAIQAFHMQKIASLIEKMAATKEGDSTLLRNSIILATTDLGDGDSHSLSNIPCLTAGQAGGRIQTGMKLDYGAKSYNHLLVSILKGMGIAENTFGDATKGSGPLAEIMV